MYNYEDIWNPVKFGQLLVKPCNCEHEVKNPQDLYAVDLWKLVKSFVYLV